MSEVRKFLKPKPKDDTDRDRLDFSSIINHRPDLGNRVIIVRSRVKDLRRKFRSDSNWALNNFNIVTNFTIAIAIVGIALEPDSISHKLINLSPTVA